ncbi:MAG: site-specific DNA-methyltransferase [Spirochaetes bacterium]|nr:site-specific DNA-methyltransferase [Spirochaetota bacterium]
MQRSPRNKTITLSGTEQRTYAERLLCLSSPAEASSLTDRMINQDLFAALPFLPSGFADLLIIDPPYNMDKKFNDQSFREMSASDYEAYVDSWMKPLLRTLKPHASVYVCGDWRSSTALFSVLSRYLIVRNRITWEREKGRGALSNWKNASEDIWFCTVSDDYHFNVDAVKIRKRVVAPYVDAAGVPKDWETDDHGAFRLTHPSNLWTDITVPYWSMPENTEHPTQKPEKLIAKLILASSRPGDMVFDPFAGSGSTPVTAKKLGRHYCGIEIDSEYACITEKRLHAAGNDSRIQGYEDGIFYERNAAPNRGVKQHERSFL